MLPLFKTEITYKVYDSVESIHDRISSLTAMSFWETSPNITGTINEKHQFELYPKIIFPAISILGIPQHSVVIEGNIQQDGNCSIVDIVVRPKKRFLFLLYFLIAILAVKIYSALVTPTESVWSLVLVLSIILVGLSMYLYFSVNRFRKRFERILN